MSDFVCFIVEWAAANPHDWGDELGHKKQSAFMEMVGGTVDMPESEINRINNIGRAIRATGRMGEAVIDGHFRKHASYDRIAKELSRLAGRRIDKEEVGTLLAWAIRKAEEQYLTIGEMV